MKKSLFLCGALFALTAFVGCSDDDDPKVAVSYTHLTLPTIA